MKRIWSLLVLLSVLLGCARPEAPEPPQKQEPPEPTTEQTQPLTIPPTTEAAQPVTAPETEAATLPEASAFNGVWYLGGSREGPFLELSVGTIRFFCLEEEEKQLVYEKTGQFAALHLQVGSRCFTNGCQLRSVEPEGPTLILTRDSPMLFEAVGSGYRLYIREEQLDGELEEAYERLGALLSGELQAYPEIGTVLRLWFTPCCFYIETCQTTEDGLQPTGEEQYGTWTLADREHLHLCFEDGLEEVTWLPAPEGILELKTLGTAFYEQLPFEE